MFINLMNIYDKFVLSKEIFLILIFLRPYTDGK